MGEPIDGRPSIVDAVPRSIVAAPVSAMRRPPIHARLQTGVRAIDIAATVGRGQRLGVFAGPGVGKSTLLSMLARNTDADVIVIAMIGERGREVRDFIEHALGHEGLSRSVVVVATSDESPLLRVRAAHAASAIAEQFRDDGAHVLLMVDSITRFAHAQRQIGLAVGEPPATRGYTPSVFAALPVLLERAGALDPRRVGQTAGTVTAFYTVLVEGDDMTEPIADAVRGILDGHIILSRALGHQGHYPAIDVLDSVSRLADTVATPEHIEHRRELVRLISAYKQVEDLVQIGAYSAGSNPKADRAIVLKARIDAILQQRVDEPAPFAESVARLKDVVTATIPAPGARR
jgi:FliI/YscN family ATPase